MRDTHDAVERILDVAERLFAERGYAATSMTAVAAEVGGSKANLFHHFGSKEGLYQAVLDRLPSGHVTLLDQAIGEPDAARAAILERFLRATFAQVQLHPQRTRLFLRELLEADPQRTEQLAQAVRLSGDLEAQQLYEAQRRGLIRADLDPLLLPLLVHGAHLFYFLAAPLMARLDDSGALGEPDHYLQMFSRLLASGLLPRDEAKE